MAITGSSKVKDIMANPAAMDIIRKYVPTIDDPGLKQAAGLSLKALFGFPQAGVAKDVAKACIAELEAANLE